MAFLPPPEMIIAETEHWRVNHRIDTTLPGYLVVGAIDPLATDWDRLSQPALAEFGSVLARATTAIRECLHAERVYVARYGHTPGFNLHLHLIPCYPWMEEFLCRQELCRAWKQLYAHDSKDWPDGPEMTLLIMQEYCELRHTPPVGPSVQEAITLLRIAC